MTEYYPIIGPSTPESYRDGATYLEVVEEQSELGRERMLSKTVVQVVDEDGRSSTGRMVLYVSPLVVVEVARVMIE